jgi:hypothetical protein
MKAFWEAVERRLAECDRGDLCAILRAMARDTPPSERRAFLVKLSRVEDTSAVVDRALRQDELLSDIEDLAQEIRQAGEGTDAWMDHYRWYEYDEEDSLGPYERYIAPLSKLFDRADAAFDYGHLPLARAAYRELFEILDYEDDYGLGIRFRNLEDVEAGETCARYLRAVYESEPLANRPQALYTQMRLVRVGLARPRPMLDDLIQISPRPLPEQDRFLVEWIAFLRTQEHGDADRLLREGVRLAYGAPGLEALARSEGQRRPRAYLDWCVALEEEGKPREVLSAAQEALRELPADFSVRAEIADRLCAAAVQLGETEALRAGRWEAFRAQLSLSRLLDLRDTGTASEEKRSLMQQVARYVRNHRTRPPDYQIALEWDTADEEQEHVTWIDRSVLAHAYLLAGEFGTARQLVQGQKVLGWSSSSSAQGLVVAFLLVLLSERAPADLPRSLASVWRSGLGYSTGSWYGEGEFPLRERLEDAYAEFFSHLPAVDYRPESVLSWCLGIVRRRVDEIVGGQKRGAYGKAAVLTLACAETIRLRGDPDTAEALVREIRGRYPRHSAFQRLFKSTK